MGKKKGFAAAAADDLYNLSVRKKAMQLCRRLFEDLCRAQGCYSQIAGEDAAANRFMSENEQIMGIISSIAKAISPREKMAAPKFTPPSKAKIRSYLSALLCEIASDIVSLTSLVNIPRMQRELVLAGDLLLKQLTYILPYKIQ